MVRVKRAAAAGNDSHVQMSSLIIFCLLFRQERRLLLTNAIFALFQRQLRTVPPVTKISY